MPCRECLCPGSRASGHSYAETCYLDDQTMQVRDEEDYVNDDNHDDDNDLAAHLPLRRRILRGQVSDCFNLFYS